MNKYRVKINGVDLGIWQAESIERAQWLALKSWKASGCAEAMSFVITRED